MLCQHFEMASQWEGPELVKMEVVDNFNEGPSECKIFYILLWFEPEPFSMW